MITLLAALTLQSAEAPAEPDLIAELISSRQEAVDDITAAPADEPGEVDVVRIGPFVQFGCRGDFIEGGTLVCFGPARSRFSLGEVSADAGESGLAILGIPRQAPEQLRFRIERGGAEPTGAFLINEMVPITQREYNLQRVDGVPQRTVTPDPSTLPRRQREYAQKQAAFNSVWDGQGFLDGFVEPSHGVQTGVYGSARVYNNGHEGSPHWGLDWANEPGTPVVAPAGGLVTLAEADMYYEGGLVFIDHGQGLVSAFLHMSAVHVEEGEFVEQGELIGEIGSGGRSTGPHLDWRVKLRNQFYVDPAILLELDVDGLGD